MFGGRGKIVALGVVVIIAAILAGDWFASQSRLRHITIDGYLDPPTVVADGQQSTVLTVEILENGQPRVGDLVQSFLESGNGLLIPEWAYTDENGRIYVTFSPTPLTQYDLAQRTVIRVTDIGIGRLVEAGTTWAIEVGLEAPTDSGSSLSLTQPGN